MLLHSALCYFTLYSCCCATPCTRGSLCISRTQIRFLFLSSLSFAKKRDTSLRMLSAQKIDQCQQTCMSAAYMLLSRQVLEQTKVLQSIGLLPPPTIWGGAHSPGMRIMSMKRFHPPALSFADSTMGGGTGAALLFLRRGPKKNCSNRMTLPSTSMGIHLM